MWVSLFLISRQLEGAPVSFEDVEGEEDDNEEEDEDEEEEMYESCGEVGNPARDDEPGEEVEKERGNKRKRYIVKLF